MTQAGKKADVEFIISGDDNVSQLFKRIIDEMQNIQSQSRRTGREVDSSMDQMEDSARRAGNGVQTVSVQLKTIGQNLGGLKRANEELRETDNNARAAGRQMERGFREGGRAADQAANRVNLLKQRVAEVTREMRSMFDSINQGTAGFQSFVGDQVRRGAYVGGLAVTGFATQSAYKHVNEDYEIAQVGSVMKSSFTKNGQFDEKAYNEAYTKVRQTIIAEGLRQDREPNKVDVAQMSRELLKNGIPVEALADVIPIVNEFAQAHKDGKGAITSNEAAKYLSNKLESKQLEYTPENFQRVADQFTKAVDMSSLDARDVLFSDQYTDATTSGALGNVDNAIQQAMNVILSKYSIDGTMAGTTLRTLFLESSKFEMTDAELDKASSDKVRNTAISMLKDLNSVNAAVEADKNISADQKGNEKVLRKLDIASNYMAQLSPDQRQEVGEMLLGKEAFGATVLLTPEGVRDFKEAIAGIQDSSGLTKRYADDKANTAKGDIVALGKAVDAVQGKIGLSLEPMVESVANQLTELATTGMFSFEEIEKGIEKSAERLRSELNPEIGDIYEQLMDLASNGFQIGVALTPLAEGTGKAIIDLLNGDVVGATKAIALAIDATDLKIENLPGELQGLANAAKNAAIFLGAIALLDKGVTIAENGKKVWDAGQKVGEKLRGSGGSNGGTVVGDDDRTIRANVVNVYGGKVNGTDGSKDGGGPVPVPTSSSKDGKNNEPDKSEKETVSEKESNKKAPGKWNTRGGKIAGWTGTSLLALSALGLTDGIPEGMQEVLEYYGWGSMINNLAGNPAGALTNKLPVGVRAGGVPAAIGFSWYKGIDMYGDYYNENQVKNFYKEYSPTGVDRWLLENAQNKLQPASTPEGMVSPVYSKEKRGIIDFLMSKKETKYASVLQGFSDQLLSEAKSNAAMDSKFLITGYDESNIDTLLQKRLNEYYSLNSGDSSSVEVEKRYRRITDSKRAADNSREQEQRDRSQYLREIENDPFLKSSYKKQMIEEMTRPASPSSEATSLIPTLVNHLNKLQEKPIEVHSNNNLRVTVEDNRSVQVQMENVSDFANRTYNDRTLTPMQTVKMRQLE
ncbi:hypothetical protein [Brevibacillus sp. FIR094]|uniref:hypothetical protein n=1 Tax=Brevibacillus sp. FIR094 TaxID=3134809 RepID=UPI003D1A56E0